MPTLPLPLEPVKPLSVKGNDLTSSSTELASAPALLTARPWPVN